MIDWYFIFKIHLKAIKSGYRKNKKGLRINVKIVEKNEIIKNEIRKNNLLFKIIMKKIKEFGFKAQIKSYLFFYY